MFTIFFNLKRLEIETKSNMSSIIIFTLVIFINLILLYAPLLNILSYESSMINAVMFSLLSGIYWLTNSENKTLKHHSVFFFFLILFPLIILSISTVFCQKCPLDDGFYFYLILSIPSIPIGIAISEFAKYISKRFRYWLFPLFWIIVLLSFLPELYYNPQIYFYNPIFGYYPGVIYDQSIEITSKLIIYRAANFIISIIIILIFNVINNFNKISKSIVITAVMLLYLVTCNLKSNFHFSTNLERIKDELSTEINTENFQIIIPSSLTEREVLLLKYEHEYYYENLKKLFNSEPDNKITSIIFESGAQKKRLFGSANADVAKPWLNQIYLNYDNYSKSLKHEIAHIFSAKYADGLFNIPSNINPGMIEGFAMAAENNYDNYDIDFMASLAYQNKYQISLVDLFTNFSFFSNASSLSYIYAGSFLKYLAENYSWEEIKQIYKENDFENVFGANLSQLEQNYYNYLEKFKIEDSKHISNYYFGRKPLIKKICARATAKELKTAQNLYNNKEYSQAADIFLRIYNYSGSYSALVGFVRSKFNLDERDSSIDFINDNLLQFKGTAYYYFLEFLLADFYALNLQPEKAKELYARIINQNPHQVYTRSAQMKKDLLSIGDSVLIYYMNDKKFKVEKLIYQIRNFPSDHSLQTLSSLDNINELDYQERIDIIEETLNEKSFSSATYFELAKFAYNFLDFNNSLKFAELALKNSNFKRKLIIEEHISKIEWIKKTHNQ